MRKNLTISAETQVAALLFEGTKCVGVKALVKGREQEFRANEVILSSGAIHSPAHLLRAGIGPAGPLKDVGVELRANLPGVGQRLMDHPSVSVSSFIKPGARLNGITRRHILLALRYSSGIGGAPPGDMFAAGSANRPGMRSASRSVRCCSRSTRPIRRPVRSSWSAPTGGPSRWSNSTCCPTGATSTG
jgi:hypothetical protein